MYLNMSSSHPRAGALGKVEGVYLVAAKQAPAPPNTRLAVGDYIADILLDARPEVTIYHWIVQRVGSAAIIRWGQEYTFEDAHSTVTPIWRTVTVQTRKKPRPRCPVH